jgi:1-deoxy-D-xylulose-5-phosphate synthase
MTAAKVNDIEALRLEDISSPAFLKDKSPSQLQKLAEDMRQFLIENLARTGGHLAPNLGSVESILALHHVFRFPRDEIVFDVGHQAYVHKILTARGSFFDSLRQFNGLSGFFSSEESIYDPVLNGHGGTSISTALGLAFSRDLQNREHNVIAYIGDGALTEGMALEAINHLGHVNTKLIIILNDNGMSIAPNVGGFSRYFEKVRNEPYIQNSQDYFKHLVKKVPQYGDRLYGLLSRVKGSFKYLMTPGIVFEELGLHYMGPVNGHNMEQLISSFRDAAALDEPVLIHIKTSKGKGFAPAEDNPEEGPKWHGGGPFNPETGCFTAKSQTSFSKVFGETLTRIADSDSRVCAITAAMRDGTGLAPFQKAHPERFFDAAMAEQHAVTLSSGLASGGLKPWVAIYSSFMQRAYDQVMHDCCLQHLPIKIALDRSGLVGDDGPTHHGVFDPAYLRNLPGLTILAPRGLDEFPAMLEFMNSLQDGPSVIRYPRGAGIPLTEEVPLPTPIELGKGELISSGEDMAILAWGNMLGIAMKLAENLKSQNISAAVFNARFLKPLDEANILELAKSTGHIVTLEDSTITGGFGSAVLELLSEHKIKADTLRIGIPDEFITHGTVAKLFKHCGLDDETLLTRVVQWFNN